MAGTAEAMLLGKSLGLAPDLLANILNTSVSTLISKFPAYFETQLTIRNRLESVGHQKRIIQLLVLHQKLLLLQIEIMSVDSFRN